MSSLHRLLFFGLTPAWMGLFYFFGLLCSWPLIFSMILLVLFLTGFFWGFKLFLKSELKVDAKFVWSIFILSGILLVSGIILARPYGDIDATTMWNYYARFLYYPQYWKQLYVFTGVGHYSHPLLLPAAISCMWQLTGSFATPFVPQFLGWLPTILMPYLLFIFFYERSKWIGLGLGILLAGNVYYLNMGLNQYADIWVCFYFFCSVLSVLKWRESKSEFWVWIWASALGAASFSKNEGLFLSALSAFLLFRFWFYEKRWRFALAGFLPFGGAILAHKVLLPVQSPVVMTWHQDILPLLTDQLRYQLVLKYLKDNLSGLYSIMAWGLFAVMWNDIRLRRFPDGLWWLLVLAVFGYTAIFLTLTAFGLEWNLANTMPRLLLHVMPAAYLFIAQNFLVNKNMPDEI